MWIGVVWQCVLVGVVLVQDFTAGNEKSQQHCHEPIKQQPVTGTAGTAEHHPVKETTEQNPIKGTAETPTIGLNTETLQPSALIIITSQARDCPKKCDVRLEDGRCKPDLNCLLESAPPLIDGFLTPKEEEKEDLLALEGGGGGTTLGRMVMRMVSATAEGKVQLDTCDKVSQKESETCATLTKKESEKEERDGPENVGTSKEADEGIQDLKGTDSHTCRGHCIFEDISGHCRLDLVCLMGLDHDSTLAFFSDFPAFAPAARALAISAASSLPSTSSTPSSTPEERVVVVPIRDCPKKCQVRNKEGDCVIDFNCPDGMT